MSDVIILYVTTPDRETARRIGRTLVEEGLAACINIIGGMESIYRWQGVVEQATEWVLLVKAPAAEADRAGDRIRALHPYDLPCILNLPITGGNPPYLDWLARTGH
jgi:periplasmic divalent cation tolerance protein